MIKKKLEINRKIQENDSCMEIVARQQIDNEIYAAKQWLLLAHDGTTPPPPLTQTHTFQTSSRLRSRYKQKWQNTGLWTLFLCQQHLFPQLYTEPPRNQTLLHWTWTHLHLPHQFHTEPPWPQNTIYPSSTRCHDMLNVKSLYMIAVCLLSFLLFTQWPCVWH